MKQKHMLSRYLRGWVVALAATLGPTMAFAAGDFSVSIGSLITQGDASGSGILPNPGSGFLVIAGPGIIEYTATAHNGGPDPEPVTLQIPAVATLSSDPNFQVSITSGNGMGQAFQGCTIQQLGGAGCTSTSTLANNGDAELKIEVNVGSQNVAGATINVSADVSSANDPIPGNNSSAVHTKTIVNLHDLEITKTAQPASLFFAGGEIQYDISVSNLGTFSQSGGNSAASSNAFAFVVTDVLDVDPSPNMGHEELVSLVPAANFSCTPGAGPLPFGGPNAPSLVICQFTGAAGLAPGAGSIPVVSLTVRTGADFNMVDAVPDEVTNMAFVDSNPQTAGIRRDLNGGTQPSNNLVGLTGNNVDEVTTAANGVVPVGGQCNQDAQCVGGSSCRAGRCQACIDACAPAVSNNGLASLIGMLSALGLFALWRMRRAEPLS